MDVDNKVVVKNWSEYEVTPFKLVIKYDYSAVELVNITLTIPYLQSLQTPQSISTNSFKK